jgi:hypothetical protein
MAVAGGSIWVADPISAIVYRIDPATEAVQAAIPIPLEPNAGYLIKHDGAPWYVDTATGALVRIDPKDGSPVLLNVRSAKPSKYWGIAASTAPGAGRTAVGPPRRQRSLAHRHPAGSGAATSGHRRWCGRRPSRSRRTPLDRPHRQRCHSAHRVDSTAAVAANQTATMPRWRDPLPGGTVLQSRRSQSEVFSVRPHNGPQPGSPSTIQLVGATAQPPAVVDSF